MLMTTFQELSRIFRAEGWRGIWFRAMSRTIYRRLVLVERMLDEPLPPLEADVSLTFCLLSPDQAEEYCLLREASPEAVRERLDSGHQCFAAYSDGRMVAVCWAAVDSARIDYLETELPLAGGEAYLYDSFTLPELRGRNVAGARGMHMIRHFREAGYRRLLAAYLPENKAAIQPILKLGYRPYAVAVRWKIGPWRGTSLRPTARR
jgi:GNAT superfamily N-acetyltransferase